RTTYLSSAVHFAVGASSRRQVVPCTTLFRSDVHRIFGREIDNYGTVNWTSGDFANRTGGNFVNKAGSFFNLLNTGNNIWHVIYGERRRTRAISGHQGATPVEDGFNNDVNVRP